MNLKYVNNTCRLAAASMIRNGGGSIVNVSSIASVSANPFGIAYSAAKAGVNAYSNTAAIEWAQHGIRVNVVAPGNTRTPKNSAEVTPDVESGRVPLNRRGRPEDIGYAVLFFLSDLSGYVTGQFIAVDGGSLTLPSSLSGDLLPAAVSGLPHADIMRGRMTDAIARARVGGPADHE
jgi:3-oxoacyl-[acyl-carrier protein] reductase